MQHWDVEELLYENGHRQYEVIRISLKGTVLSFLSYELGS